MEELPVGNFSVHRLRRRLAESGERSPLSPLAGEQKLSESLPSPPALPIPPPPPASLPDLSPPSTPSPLHPAIYADPDSASAASPTFAPPPPPPLPNLSPPSSPFPLRSAIHAGSPTFAPPPPPLPRASYSRRFSATSSPTAAHPTQASSPEHPGQEQRLPEGNAQKNSAQSGEGEHATQQKEAETSEIAARLSLNQHVQQDDTAREEAMRSFILDRFLPAAKAVAAEHESSISVASRNRVLPPSASTTQATQKAPSSHSSKARAQPPSHAPKGVTWSRPLHSKEQEKGSSHCQDISCGFFCVGLKTALSRAHRTVSTSACSVSRSKSRAPSPSSHVNTTTHEDNNSTNSDEEEAFVPKSKVTLQSMRKQSTLTPASISYSSNSPTTPTFQGSSPRYAASLRDSFPRGNSNSTSLGGSPGQSITSSASTPLHSQSGRCSPLHDHTGKHNLIRSPPHDHVGGTSLGGTPLHEKAVGTSKGGTPPHDQGNPSNLRDHARGIPLHDQTGGTSLVGTPPHDHVGGTSLVGTPPHDHVGGTSLVGTPPHDHVGGTSLVCTSMVGTPPNDQGDPSNLRGTHPRDHARGNTLHDQTGTPLHDLADGIIMNGTHLPDQAGRTSSKDSPTHVYAIKSSLNLLSPLRDQDGIEDDEPQFYDALSRLNSMRSTPGNVTPYTIGSPKSQYDAFGFASDWTNDEAGFTDASSHFETPRASTSDSKSVGSDASHARNGWQSQISMGVKTSSLSQRVGKGLRLETGGEQAGMQDKDRTYHLLCEQSTSVDPVHVAELQQQHVDLRKETSSRRMRRPSLENKNGVCSASTSSVTPIFPAKCQKNTPNGRTKWAAVNDLGWPFGISSYNNTGTQRKSSEGQQKSNDRFVPGLNVPSPPLPPSPAGSWLEKAITMNASKPSALATLQQKDKTMSARKKLEFTSTDAIAEVRWEDVVKGSQTQPGHLRFSEELHHHHPSVQS